MTRLKPESLRPIVDAANDLAPDQNAILNEGSRVAKLFEDGHLQEINFEQVSKLMMELCIMAYNGADCIQGISRWMQTNEPKAWRNLVRHLNAVRAQNAQEDALSPKIKVGP